MKVTDIDIVGLRYDRGAACHEGHVSMQLAAPTQDHATRRLQFLCHSGQGENSSSTLVTFDLIRDALRQAHRMPGFRRGEHTIEVELSPARIAGKASA